MKLTKWEKMTVLLSAVFALTFGFGVNAVAMHIMEGYLLPEWAIGWGALCVPFLVLAFIGLRRRVKEEPKAMVLLALCGAFAFVLSALKIPSVTGSCSHPTGVGLGAILFGPFAMSLISLIVLLFQALLLAHGGLTTLGANTFSMGIVGPIASWGIYALLRKAKVNTSICVFFAACLGDLLTYATTSLQLALAYPDGGSVLLSLGKFLSIFALTQIPLAVCEGLLTVVVFGVLQKYSRKELQALGALS